MGKIKERNGVDPIEAEEIKKRWQEDIELCLTKKILMIWITTMMQSLT